MSWVTETERQANPFATTTNRMFVHAAPASLKQPVHSRNRLWLVTGPCTAESVSIESCEAVAQRTHMARRRHTPDQIIAKLRDIEVLIAEGMSIAEATKQMEISEQTFHRWRKQYGGMKRLKDLEKENQQLKRLVADQALEVRFLKDIAEGNF